MSTYLTASTHSILCCLLLTAFASIAGGQQTKEYSLEITFRDGKSLFLHDVRFEKNKRLSVKTGKSETLVDFDEISFIDVDIPTTGNQATLTFTTKTGNEKIIAEKSKFSNISGVVREGNVEYDFCTDLLKCLKITPRLDNSPSVSSTSSKQRRVSCVLTTTSGSTKSLTDVRVFEKKYIGTGYAGSFLRGQEINREVFVTKEEFSLTTAKGRVTVPVVHLKALNLEDGVAVFRNSMKLEFDREVGLRSSAIAGWFGRNYIAVSGEDVKSISDIRASRGVVREPPKNTSKHTSGLRLVVTDTQGNKHSLRSAKIQTPCKDVGMGRILLNMLKPDWHANFGDSAIRTLPCYGNKIAICKDGFWVAVPISQIKKLVKSENGFLIVHENGTSEQAQAAEFGKIIGKGALGEVIIDRESITAFETAE